MIIRKYTKEEEFVACLQSQGTNIFIDTWTPTQQDLQMYPHIVLTSERLWNPQHVQFPGTTRLEREEIEGRSISLVRHDLRRDERESRTTFDDPYHEPLRIFDIQAFNARIIKSSRIETRVSDGPLPEDKIMPAKTFLSSNRHSNTTPEDLSEVWNISVEQAKMTLDATTQHHVRSAIMPLSRRYRTDRMFEPKRLLGTMASDTMDPRCDSIHGTIDMRKSLVTSNCSVRHIRLLRSRIVDKRSRSLLRIMEPQKLWLQIMPRKRLGKIPYFKRH